MCRAHRQMFSELINTLIAEGKKPTVILGFNKADEIFCKEEFENIGAETIVTTVDGSVGIKGFVTDALKAEINYLKNKAE